MLKKSANDYIIWVESPPPNPIRSLSAPLKRDARTGREDEEVAIKLYKQTIDKARAENDETTHHLFRDILEEEEEHHDTFTTLLEDL
jgi:bacterioferritin